MTDMTITPEINENDPFLNKSVGVALKGPEWLFLLAVLQHICTDEEMIKSVWSTKEDYEEMCFTIRQIQRQVLLIHDKIQTPEGEGIKGKLISFKNKLIGADGKPLL